MAKATVYNVSGEKVKEVELDPKIFGIEINPELVQQAVVIQQANSRKNLAVAKDRSEVAGGGRKPWKQKGTGRARHGSIRSPLWRGGGVTFGPSKDKNYSLKINKKAKRKALLMTLSDKATNQKIILLDKLDLEEAKTKKFFEILQNLKLRSKKEDKKIVKKDQDSKDLKQKTEKKKKSKVKESSILIITPAKAEKIKRGSRNIPRTDVIQANSLNVIDILKNQYLLMPIDSLKIIGDTFTSASASVKATGVKKAKVDKK